MSPASPVHPDHLSYRVKRLYLLETQALEELLKPSGLGRTQWQVLRRLSADADVGQCELRNAMKVEAATLTPVIESLVAKGLVARREDPADKRARRLRLTPAGAAHIAEAGDPLDAVESRMLEGLAVTEATEAARLIDAMIANLETPPAGGVDHG